MAKFYGEVGYLITQEKMIDGRGSGIWEETFIKRKYYGEQINSYSRWQASNYGVNDNIVNSTQISIVADPFAVDNFMHIKYAIFLGYKWKVERAELQRPRLILTLGGLYNGPEDESSD